jgi:hypothetical protein
MGVDADILTIRPRKLFYWLPATDYLNLMTDKITVYEKPT